MVKSKGLLPKIPVSHVFQLPQTCETSGLHQLPSVKTQWPSKRGEKNIWVTSLMLLKPIGRSSFARLVDVVVVVVIRFLTLNMCLFRILFLVGDIHVSSPVK